MTLMLSSQGIGFITVVAVSGCSVMLLALGCQKLLELKRDSARQQHSCEEENLKSSPESRGSHSWRSLPTFSIADYYRKDEFSLVLNQCQGHDQCEEGASVSWRIHLSKRRPNPMEAFRLKNKGESGNGMPTSSIQAPDFCYETPGGSCRASDANETSQTPSAKKRNLGKKVRFSADVVEPSGNNVEYRRRHTVAIRSRCLRTQGNPGDVCSPNSPPTTIGPETYSSSFLTRSERRESPPSVGVSRKPNIPPNRMALYNGIAQYRSQRVAFY